MVQLKTAKERLEKRLEKKRQRDRAVLERFEENCKVHSISDAVTITADEFDLSPVTIYNIRKRNS